ncbi:MAG: dTDP-glucose 4,6-dehydratase [Candidatus Schekmanbacteria bacterium]|nr:dTDP-glucose 4,6-dehydratase [Candidatus Schekmanbacteria bacterium]
MATTDACLQETPQLPTPLLVTGGAGFIGSHFVEHMLLMHPALRIVVLDKLTYAGRKENLADVEAEPSLAKRLRFVHGDIADRALVGELLKKEHIAAVVNFAAETHVDRSLHEAIDFLNTDVVGVYQLLVAARQHNVSRFVQVSTDEVYGSVESGASKESDPMEPRSPYSASKAAADLMALAFFTSYGMHVSITRGSNTYGPRQFPEKLIPLFITNALEDRPLPLYGDGKNVRDWLHVRDHCRGIEAVLMRGEAGSIYNIGGDCGKTNLEVTEAILNIIGKPTALIRFVQDRPGHDRRYALDTSRARRLGFQPQTNFELGLRQTVLWYRDNVDWWKSVIHQDKDFRAYYERQYGNRLRNGVEALAESGHGE